jgi:hypothetical protein
MLRKPQFWIALIVMAAILFVFIAPSVDLDPTALRAWQAACAIFLALATICRVVTTPLPRLEFAAPIVPLSKSSGARSTIQLNSVLLC